MVELAKSPVGLQYLFPGTTSLGDIPDEEIDGIPVAERDPAGPKVNRHSPCGGCTEIQVETLDRATVSQLLKDAGELVLFAAWPEIGRSLLFDGINRQAKE